MFSGAPVNRDTKTTVLPALAPDLLQEPKSATGYYKNPRK